MDTGEKRTYMLRRLRCKNCGSLHTELPDIMVPHKHYASDVIEQVIDEHASDCPADDSTLFRWLKWWHGIKEDVEARLQAVYSRHHRIQIPLLHDFSLLESLKTNGPGWLADVHRILLLTGYQIHTRFAFCP